MILSLIRERYNFPFEVLKNLSSINTWFSEKVSFQLNRIIPPSEGVAEKTWNKRKNNPSFLQKKSFKAELHVSLQVTCGESIMYLKIA